MLIIHSRCVIWLLSLIVAVCNFLVASEEGRSAHVPFVVAKPLFSFPYTVSIIYGLLRPGVFPPVQKKKLISGLRSLFAKH